MSLDTQVGSLYADSTTLRPDRAPASEMRRKTGGAGGGTVAERGGHEKRGAHVLRRGGEARRERERRQPVEAAAECRRRHDCAVLLLLQLLKVQQLHARSSAPDPTVQQSETREGRCVAGWRQTTDD